MAKYMVLYNSSVSGSDTMANASPEQIKASMDEWIKWKDKASESVKVEFGMPLQAINHVTQDGVGVSQNEASGYSILEGDSIEKILELLQKHPHLQRPGASIDLLEFLSMPGL